MNNKREENYKQNLRVFVKGNNMVDGWSVGPKLLSRKGTIVTGQENGFRDPRVETMNWKHSNH